jgi:hypothetical protein
VGVVWSARVSFISAHAYSSLLFFKPWALDTKLDRNRRMDMAGDPLHAKGVGKRYDASKIRCITTPVNRGKISPSHHEWGDIT